MHDIKLVILFFLLLQIELERKLSLMLRLATLHDRVLHVHEVAAKPLTNQLADVQAHVATGLRLFILAREHVGLVPPIVQRKLQILREMATVVDVLHDHLELALLAFQSLDDGVDVKDAWLSTTIHDIITI